MKDLQSCMDKAQEKKAKKKKKKQQGEASCTTSSFLLIKLLLKIKICLKSDWKLLGASTEEEEEEPEWVEVMVDILLSLLSQPSRHIRQVCKTVFSSICPHVTAAALSAILDVSNTRVHSSRRVDNVLFGHRSRHLL